MQEPIVARNLAEQIDTIIRQPDLDNRLALELLGELHPADIAEVLDDLSDDTGLVVFNLLTHDLASEVLGESEGEVTQLLFDRLPEQRLAELLNELPMDDAARLLSRVAPEQAEELVRRMSSEEAAHVRSLLAYPEGTAGRLMNEDFVRLRGRWTIAESLDYLRQVDSDTEIVAYLYVTDAGGRLTGVVPLRRIVTAKPDQTVAEIRDTRVIAVSVMDSRDTVAEIITKYDFFALPVVDELGRLVGIVTVDDIMDVLEEAATEDIQRLGGSEPLLQPYFSIPLITVARKRVGWLLLLFLGATLTISVTSFFEETLSRVVALSFFMPLLIGTGGNAGSQTVSTVIRALAVGEVAWQDSWRVLAREFATGLLVGSFLGVIGFIFTYFFWGQWLALALVIGLTLPVICTWSNLVAGLVPILAENIGIDPTVISAPLITTVVDATGLIVYFTIANVILGL